MKNFSNYKDYDKKEDWRIGSKVVHGALGGEPVTGSVSFPIFQTATFKFRGLGDSLGFDYTRCQNPTIEELESVGLGAHFTMHDHAVFPADPSGVPFTTAYISATGDYIADLESDMAAEQRARATYEHLMDLTDDPDILAPLSFLRQREIVHYQRFKELRNYYLNEKI